MAYSYTEVIATGSPQMITVPPYIDQAHISVLINGTPTVLYSWVNTSTISATAAAGAKIRVKRSTSPAARVVDYIDGMSLTETVLDNDSKQAFYLAQEQLDATSEALTIYPSLEALAASVEAAAASGNSVQRTGDTMSGDLQFGGNSLRLKADMSNATLSYRFALQTSTANGATAISAVPNGTGNQTQVTLYTDSAMTNGNYGGLTLNPTQFMISTGVIGTGTAVPITFAINGVERWRITPTSNLACPADPYVYSYAGGVLGQTRSAIQFNGTSQLLQFLTGQTERFRVGPAGQLGIGVAANYGAVGQVLTSGGPSAAPSWSSSGFLGVKIFTSSGTYTPTAGTTKVLIQARGGGGGGGGGGGQNGVYGGSGGGGGAASPITFAFVAVSAPQPVTIGAGGVLGASQTGAAAGTAGGTGGNTTLGALFTAPGALGGGGGQQGNLGVGAGATGAASIDLPSTSGSPGIGLGVYSPCVGAVDGSGGFGGGSAGPGNPFNLRGSGGNGSSGRGTTPGSAGGTGYMIIYEYA